MIGEQRIVLDNVHPWESSEHFGEVFLGLDAPPPATGDRRVDCHTTPPSLRMPDEQPPPAARPPEAGWRIPPGVVDFAATSPQVAIQRLVLVQGVTDRLAQHALV